MSDAHLTHSIYDEIDWLEGEGVKWLDDERIAYNVQYISSAKMFTRIKQVELVRAIVYVHDKIFQIDRFYVGHVGRHNRKQMLECFFFLFLQYVKKS